MDINQLSEQLLLQVKNGTFVEETREQLEAIPWGSFVNYFQSDNRKKAFWINVYNAYFLYLRRELEVEKPDIYRKKLINVAGNFFSLDDIEHGILRRFRLKWAKGYLADPFVSLPIRQLALEQIDPRIHFALNCGAISCPPIAFYSLDKLHQQLEMATLSFLEADVEVLPESKEVHISRLFHWYIGDFGGRNGIKRFLRDKLDLEIRGMKLVYKTYNWEEQLDNFVE